MPCLMSLRTELLFIFSIRLDWHTVCNKFYMFVTIDQITINLKEGAGIRVTEYDFFNKLISKLGSVLIPPSILGILFPIKGQDPHLEHGYKPHKC